VYFVLLITLVSLLALFGWTNGCDTMRVLYDPHQARASIEKSADAHRAKLELPLVDALLANRSRAVPIAAGKFVLALVLWISTLAILFGRGKVRSLLIQTMVAYGVFLCVSYAVRAPMRAMEIEAWLGEMQAVEGHTQEEVVAVVRPVAFWVARAILASHLAILAAGVFARTRPRVRAWLAPPDAGDVPQ
jgi:hypothetical protein